MLACCTCVEFLCGLFDSGAALLKEAPPHSTSQDDGADLSRGARMCPRGQPCSRVRLARPRRPAAGPPQEPPPSPPPRRSYPLLKDYRPETDVQADARIDLDMEEILAELTDGDLAGAMAKYRGGTNGVQTLASLSKPGASSMASDTWWPVYKAYWSSNNDYADTFVEDAYAGSLPDGMKKELIKKGIAYQGVWMYAAHLFDKGMRECVTKDWDRGVAHYIGELEGGTESGASLASTGHLLYNLAQKRCADFGTCATGTDSSTLADANNRVMNEHAVLGRDLLIQQKCTDARLATSFNSIISQMTVPLVQARRPRRNFLLAPSVRSSTRQLHLLDSGPRFSSIINAHTGPAQVRVEGRPGERQLVQRRGWE